MKRPAAFVVGLALCLIFPMFVVSSVVQHYRYSINVGGRLKRAADANTVELARTELEAVIPYLEERGWTGGYTSLIIRTPDEDVGFWYRNLTSSLEELKRVGPETSQLEGTNVLMKLRETLLDNHGQGGPSVTAPAGIAVYPHNWGYTIWGLGGFIILLVGGLCIVASFMDE